MINRLLIDYSATMRELSTHPDAPADNLTNPPFHYAKIQKKYDICKYLGKKIQPKLSPPPSLLF